MIDERVMEELKKIASRVKAVLGDRNATVQINVGHKQPEAIVNMTLTNVTGVKAHGQ